MSQYHKEHALLEEIPIFPLRGAVLLPRAQLPLNIFEPRYRAMIEDRYDQLSKNLESHLASKATIFDKPLADIISSDRIYRLIRGRGIRTIGELLSQPLEVVKNIDGLGASSWSKLENNLLNFSTYPIRCMTTWFCLTSRPRSRSV